jgi:glycerophosphoryl diester phosphodiesterase
MVELDVRRTADDALVVHHDAAIDDGRLIVESRAADLPEWLPSLETALAACDGMSVNIEIKNSPRDPDYDADDRVAVAVAALVGRLDVRDRIIVSSFNLATIAAVRVADAGIATGWLTMPGIDAMPAIATATDGGHAALHPYENTVTKELIDAAHAVGLQINTWTVDDVDRMRELASWGVDGIVTNVPDVAFEVLRVTG